MERGLALASLQSISSSSSKDLQVEQDWREILGRNPPIQYGGRILRKERWRPLPFKI